MAIRISSSLRMALSRSVKVVEPEHLARIENMFRTARMSFMYCGRRMLEIKLSAVPMLSKCQVSTLCTKLTSNAGHI